MFTFEQTKIAKGSIRSGRHPDRMPAAPGFCQPPSGGFSLRHFFLKLPGPMRRLRRLSGLSRSRKVARTYLNKRLVAIRFRAHDEPSQSGPLGFWLWRERQLRSRLIQTWSSAMAERRRRLKRTQTFEELLAEEAARFRIAADELPPGTARELLLRRARLAETASHMNDWLHSPGLQPPR
jgi:hypothetical protein